MPPEKDDGNIVVVGVGVIHYKFLESGRTITAVSHHDEIDETYRKLRELQPALVNTRGLPFFRTTAQTHALQKMPREN